MSSRNLRATAIATAFFLVLAGLPAAKVSRAAQSAPPEAMQERRGQSNPYVFKDRIRPHWIHGDSRFWYRNDLAGGTKEFVLVDAEAGTRSPAFDHGELAASLSLATNTEHAADRLPFDVIEHADDGRAVRFKVGEATWECDLETYACQLTEASATLDEATSDSGRRGSEDSRGRGGESDSPLESPDGAWSAFVRDGELFVARAESGAEVRLGAAREGDGDASVESGETWSGLEWSPDSKSLLAWKTRPEEREDVFLVQSSPPEGGRAKLHRRGYGLPGDAFPLREPRVFDVETWRRIEPEVDPFEHEWSRPRIHWSADGRRLAYEQVDRGHQRLRVVEIDAGMGAVRTLLEEVTDTFIWTAHDEGLDLRRVNWLEDTEEMIYVSERDGWRHLYLVDTQDGALAPITQGEWVVRGIDLIDEEKRQIWFTASGRYPDQDPYFEHAYRIDFDGTDLVALTEGDGQHSIQYSPDRRYLIDTYSRVDMAPRSELRRASSGELVCPLEEADISALVANGWKPPEVFVAKGRDGVTDIWGILSLPKDYDPNAMYPVIEDIYAGPQDSFVPKSFSPERRYAELADRGFVVVRIDGMGTANRSKAFHDVCWKNLKDAGFPDRILWMRAAAEKFRCMDLTRVGVFGGSAGGQNAAGALLFHPDFYEVAVANCGCHDNRMDKASWNEQWMGYPVGPQYSECSNVDNAHRLQGKLFLIVGEMDTNVPPESTLRFADALIRAGKDFELLVVPNAEHGTRGSAGSYVVRRTHDFFVRHLQGTEPPDRNPEPSPGTARPSGGAAGDRRP